MPDVTRAIRSVEQAAAAASKSQTTTSQRGARERVSAADREAKEKIRLMARGDAEVKRIQDREVRNAERAANQRLAAEARAERAMVREAEKSANERIRIGRQVDREQASMQRRREMENRRILREGARLEERTHREQTAKFQREERQRQTTKETFARAAFGGVGKGVSTIGRGIAATAGAVAQLGGGFSVADSVMGEANLRKKAAVLSANTILSGAGKKGADASLGKAMSTDEILGKAKAIGIQQNIEPEKVLDAIDEIKKLTGNVEKATNVVGSVAKLSTATGGDVKEMSGLAANILAANPNISDKDLNSQMRIFAKQGIVGGVEVADMAKYGSRLTAGASMYGGSKEKNEATLGAMSQMARQYGSAGTAAEATLGSLRFSTDVAKHADKLKAGGIDVSDHKGNLKDAQSIMIDMLKKTKGDVTKLSHLGLGDRGVKPLEGVANIYKNAGGGDKGLEAVKAEFAKYTTGITEDEIEAANKRILSEQQAEIEIKKLKQMVGETLLPELAKLVPVLREAMPTIQAMMQSFVRLAEWAGSNPFSAMGAVLAASVAKEVAGAGLKTILEKSLATSLGSSGGLIVGSAMMAITTGVIAIETIAHKQSMQVSKDVNTSNAAVVDAAGVRLGDRTTSKDVKSLTAERDAMKASVEKQRENVNSREGIEYLGLGAKALLSTPIGYAASKIGGVDRDDMDQGAAYQKSREDRLKQSEQGLESLNKALVVAAKNLETLGRAAPAAGAAAAAGAKPAGAAASTGIAQRTQ